MNNGKKNKLSILRHAVDEYLGKVKSIQKFKVFHKIGLRMAGHLILTAD